MWKNILKKFFLVAGLLVLVGIIGLTSLYAYFTYRNNQAFGELKTSFEPGKLGRNVSPFIGTGGHFWVVPTIFRVLPCLSGSPD
jgi:hypothetical protein